VSLVAGGRRVLVTATDDDDDVERTRRHAALSIAADRPHQTTPDGRASEPTTGADQCVALRVTNQPTADGWAADGDSSTDCEDVRASGFDP